MSAKAVSSLFFCKEVFFVGLSLLLSDIIPKRAPTSTLSPSFAEISFNTPEIGDGTSNVTFSVSNSTSGSSEFILSPGDFIHLAIVASTTDSPKVGTNNSTVISIFLRPLIFILLLKQC